MFSLIGIFLCWGLSGYVTEKLPAARKEFDYTISTLASFVPAYFALACFVLAYDKAKFSGFKWQSVAYRRFSGTKGPR